MKSERHKLPTCDRDWFLDNGLWLIESIGHQIALDYQNSAALDELEKCKNSSKRGSNDGTSKDGTDIQS